MLFNDYWQRVGDPTIIGWTITIAYFIAAFLCWRTGRIERENNLGTRNSHSYFLWFGLLILLILLGINKQLDLQTLLTSLGREISMTQGWYGKRREVQFVFTGFLGLFGLLSIGVFIWWLRNRFWEFWLIILGLVLLFSFIFIRAASFNHVNYLLNKWSVIGPFRMKYFVELGGIVLLGFGAIQRIKKSF
jgi:hypothetical protein